MDAFSQPSFGRSWGDIELAARFDRIDLNGTEVMGGSSNRMDIRSELLCYPES